MHTQNMGVSSEHRLKNAENQLILKLSLKSVICHHTAGLKSHIELTLV